VRPRELTVGLAGSGETRSRWVRIRSSVRNLAFNVGPVPGRCPFLNSREAGAPNSGSGATRRPCAATRPGPSAARPGCGRSGRGVSRYSPVIGDELWSGRDTHGPSR